MDTTCELVRASLSAEADGEAAPLGHDVVGAHVVGCAGCASYAAGLPLLATAVSQVRVAPIGDRLAEVLSAGATPLRDRVPQLRGLLVLAAGVQVAIAVLGLVLGASLDTHVVADLAVYELAAGVGLGVAAWRPEYAAGLLPTIALAAAAGVLLVGIDVVTGAATIAGELTHLVLAVATWPLVVLARLHPTATTVEAR